MLIGSEIKLNVRKDGCIILNMNGDLQNFEDMMAGAMNQNQTFRNAVILAAVKWFFHNHHKLPKDHPANRIFSELTKEKAMVFFNDTRTDINALGWVG